LPESFEPERIPCGNGIGDGLIDVERDDLAVATVPDCGVFLSTQFLVYRASERRKNDAIPI
jgi:hypothetical protein